MSTVEQTRSRVSYRSEIKAQRKEAAKAYESPNRRVSYYNCLYFAAIHRGRMEDNKEAMLGSSGRGLIKVYFDSYLYNRNRYRMMICDSKTLNKPFPLP